jgi:hypothetical protein
LVAASLTATKSHLIGDNELLWRRFEGVWQKGVL